MQLDTSLFFALFGLAHISPITDLLIRFFASYFPVLVGGALVVFLYTSAYPRVQQIHIFCIAVISGLVARVGVVEIIRYFIHRPRPFLALHLQPLIQDSAWSFPSGHAAFFFAFAMAIYMYNKKWGWWFFAAATIISVSRVIAGVHYPSDILAGAVFGAACGYVVTKGVWYFQSRQIASAGL